MLDSLPYELPELVTRAPLDTHRSTVLPEWVDWNGHMNVAFYVTAFDQASGAFMRNMGLGRRYVDGKLGMTFVLETHVTYDREMREGAPMRFTTQLLARDAKRVHLFHEMFHAEQGYLAATNETIVMNIDYATRRSAPWPVPVAARLEELWQTHKDLPRPAKAGRVMGLSKKVVVLSAARTSSRRLQIDHGDPASAKDDPAPASPAPRRSGGRAASS